MRDMEFKVWVRLDSEETQIDHEILCQEIKAVLDEEREKGKGCLPKCCALHVRDLQGDLVCG
jgi:hypothetical protein